MRISWSCVLHRQYFLQKPIHKTQWLGTWNSKMLTQLGFGLWKYIIPEAFNSFALQASTANSKTQ